MARSMTGFEKNGCRIIPKDFSVVSTIHRETTNSAESAITMMAFIYRELVKLRDGSIASKCNQLRCLIKGRKNCWVSEPDNRHKKWAPDRNRCAHFFMRFSPLFEEFAAIKD
jgi:hypothetical protein